MSGGSTTGPMPPRTNHEHGTGGVLACPICRPRVPSTSEGES